MKILVFGAGSIGVFLGTKLHAAGHDVVLKGGRKLAQVHTTILIDSCVYDVPPRIQSLVREEYYDYIFVTTKLYSTQSAIQELFDKKITARQFVFIQNGLVHEGFYEKMQDKPFLTISVFEGYRLIENQLLTTKTELGWQTENTTGGREIARLLADAGIACTRSKDLDQLRAEKVALVSAVGALSTIEKKTIGELVDDPQTRQLIKNTFHESYTVLAQAHPLPPYEEVSERFWKTLENASTHYPSMYQDAVSGRNTEIEFINGLVSSLGRKYDIETPLNDELYQKVADLAMA